MPERYITTSEVSEIMNNIDQLEAFKCMGRMSEYANNIGEQLALRYRGRGA